MHGYFACFALCASVFFFGTVCMQTMCKECNHVRMVLIRLVHTIDYLCSCQKFDCDFRWQLVLLASTPAEIHATNMNGYRKLCTAICHLHVVFDVHLRN